MLAELKVPETADIIAESLALKFVGLSREELVNIKFNYDQLIAIKYFFEYCANYMMISTLIILKSCT